MDGDFKRWKRLRDGGEEGDEVDDEGAVLDVVGCDAAWVQHHLAFQVVHHHKSHLTCKILNRLVHHSQKSESVQGTGHPHGVSVTSS